MGGRFSDPTRSNRFRLRLRAQELRRRIWHFARRKKVLISGSGNVAQYAAIKCKEFGAQVLTFSDSNGTIFEPNGFSDEQIQQVLDIKNNKRGRVADYKSSTVQFLKGTRPWGVGAADVALPCATQNEISKEDAENLIKAGVKYIFEGANMPSTPEAIEVFKGNKAVFFPAKAANAGGVAVSGLEMAQNSARYFWTREEVDNKLKGIMASIWKACSETAKELGHEGDYQLGANCAGFKIVADAMIAQGYVLRKN